MSVLDGISAFEQNLKRIEAVILLVFLLQIGCGVEYLLEQILYNPNKWVEL